MPNIVLIMKSDMLWCEFLDSQKFLKHSFSRKWFFSNKQMQIKKASQWRWSMYCKPQFYVLLSMLRIGYFSEHGLLWLLYASCYFRGWLTPSSWIWRWCVPLECQFTSTELRIIMSQKIEIVITTIVRTTNPAVVCKAIPVTGLGDL
jgi:hypothetical protein